MTRGWMLVLAVAGCGRSSDGFDGLRAQEGVYGVPNLDDDDDDGTPDFRQEGVEGEDDLAPVSLVGVREGMRKRDRLVLTLSGQRSDLRVWQGDEVLLDAGVESVGFEREEVPDSVEVELGDFLTEGALHVAQLDQNDNVIDEVELRLLAAPLILNHHLQPAERVFAITGTDVVYKYYGYTFSFDNQAMIDDLDEALPGLLSAPPLGQYDFDPWVQDEFELATLTSPTSRIDVVIDSIRDRGLDPYPERVVVGSDGLVRTWGGRRDEPTSQDAFGNLEVSPPVTVDGVHYPFGRIYWGGWNPAGAPVAALRDMLTEQRVQAPFELDVSFLCVGHVDEFVSFLPDPEAPKGFRMYVADTAAGLAFVEGLDPSTALPRYETSHGYATVGDLVDDLALRGFNEDVQRDGIEPNITVLRRELGLDDADIVRVPALFEEVGCLGGRAVSLIPGTVNMLVTPRDGGGTTLFLPDPFLRPDGAPLAQDPFVQHVNGLLPADATPVWVDDWELYHVAWGEVHCGTNTTRTPTAQWWTDALHLIDEEASR